MNTILPDAPRVVAAVSVPRTISAAIGLLVMCVTILVSPNAGAVPSFARQTGLPCMQCHVGAFGPQLTQYGREFKLNGYVWTDGHDGHLPVAAMVQGSFTHTGTDQPGGAAPGFGPNNNPALDQVSLFYGGIITDHAGAFAQVTYDGVARQLHWDNLDLRYATSIQGVGKPLLIGVTVNNNPTVQDVWNSTPAWGFPFAASRLVSGPAPATLIDGGLAQNVLGAGAYARWSKLIYAEFDIYKGLGPDVRNVLGIVPVTGANAIEGTVPYWRVALEHNFGSHYLELGTFGLQGSEFPAGDNSTRRADQFTDVALDATWLYSGDPDYTITGYLTYIHEAQRLRASSILSGTNAADFLDTFRTNGSLSWHNTVTLSSQYFQTGGSADTALFGGRPGGAGWIGEIAYVPGGKEDSVFPNWLNLRLSLQYTAYTDFNGSRLHASDNNTLFLLLWIAA